MKKLHFSLNSQYFLLAQQLAITVYEFKKKYKIILEGGNRNVAKRYKNKNPFRQAAQLTYTGNVIKISINSVLLEIRRTPILKLKKTVKMNYKKLKNNKKTQKNKKTTGVKASGSGQSPENISGETNNIQSVIPEEGLRPRNILIDYDTNMDDLYQELLKESYKRYPSEITLYVVDAREFSLEDIENLSKMINKSKLIVNLNAVGCIDFTELTLFALWVTGEVNFPCCSNIHMESNISIPKNNLNRISKKISKRIGVEANLVSRLYKQKSIVEPNVIFPEF